MSSVHPAEHLAKVRRGPGRGPGRDFEEERDVRVGAGPSGQSAAAVQARRGHAARAMLAELETFIGNVYKTQERESGVWTEDIPPRRLGRN